MRVLVEASCLTWIEVDTDNGMILAVRVHALPENIRMNSEADVVALEPDEQPTLTHDVKLRARNQLHIRPITRNSFGSCARSTRVPCIENGAHRRLHRVLRADHHISLPIGYCVRVPGDDEGLRRLFRGENLSSIVEVSQDVLDPDPVRGLVLTCREFHLNQQDFFRRFACHDEIGPEELRLKPAAKRARPYSPSNAAELEIKAPSLVPNR